MYGVLTLNLFVEFIAGPKSVLDGVLVVRSMEVEKVHTISLQPLKGGFQLWANTLRLKGLPVPGIGFGSNAYCCIENINWYEMSRFVEANRNVHFIFCKHKCVLHFNVPYRYNFLGGDLNFIW